MKLRDMLAAAVRPWFSVEVEERHIVVTASPIGRMGSQYRAVLRDRSSKSRQSYMWGQEYSFWIGDLHVGCCRSWPPLRCAEKAANDSKAAA